MPVETEQDLLDQGFVLFRSLVDRGPVTASRAYTAAEGGTQDDGDAGRDDVWFVDLRGVRADLVVLAYRRFTPREVDVLAGDLARALRQRREQDLLVVAPWLSRRSQDLLRQQKINYLDLTGNVWIRLSYAPVLIHTEGASQDPDPVTQPRRGLQGKLVNALVRVLVDAAPPYRMSELAAVTGASQAYVSRTLDVLDEERLVERGRNRLITSVDWEQLLRERARSYSLIGANRTQAAIARRGLPQLLDDLRASATQVVVTGSAAVQRYARISAPTQLALYVTDSAAVETLDLMPAERGANVLLLRPAHRSQLDRTELDDGLHYAGISQLALDCLGGNGRLPEEGEALLDWMREHTTQWRRTSLAEL